MTEPTALPAVAEAREVPALKNAYGDDRRFDVAGLPEEERSAVMTVVRSVPVLDGVAVNGFGAAGQRAASAHLDTLMSSVTAADTGLGGTLLAELATGLDLIDVEGMRAEAEGKVAGLARRLAALPVVGKRFSAFARFVANRQRVASLLASIERKGEEDLVKLQAYDATLESMVAEVKRGLARMRVELMAGQVVLDRERRIFAEARDRALASRDPLELAEVRDRAETVDAFEVRLLRLHVAYTKAVVEVPRTRMVQRTGRAEYRNVLDTLLFDVPELKRRVIALAAIRNARIANEGAQARRDLNKRLDGMSMDELEQGYLASKAHEGGGLADIEEMGRLVERMRKLGEDGAALDRTNRAQREEAHAALAAVRAKLADGLAQGLVDEVEGAGFGGGRPTAAGAVARRA